MVTEATKTSHHSNAEAERSHKLLDKEIRGMLSAITNRVSGSSGHRLQEEDEENGARIITLAGTNTGATMRSELMDEKQKTTSPVAVEDDDEGLSTYVNSNFQAVNNSIMFGSSYNANDPGVHMEISEPLEDHEGERKHTKKGKKKKKGKDYNSD